MVSKKFLFALAILGTFVISTFADDAFTTSKDNPKLYRSLDGSCYMCRNCKLEGAVDGYWGTVESLRVDAKNNMAYIKFKCDSFVGKEKPFQLGNNPPEGMVPKNQYVLIKKNDDNTFKDNTLKVFFLSKDPPTADEFAAAKKSKQVYYYSDSNSTKKFTVDHQECPTCKGTEKITQKVTETVKTKTGSGNNVKTVEEPKTVNKSVKCPKCNGTGTVPVEWDAPIIKTYDSML